MSNIFVLMTALPPTKGHINLIRFAATFGAPVTVIVSTQPHEPMGGQRYNAVRNEVLDLSNVQVRWLDETLEQDPEAPGFWDMWRSIMSRFGMQIGDTIIASETYGARLAKECGGLFMPYDIDRVLEPSKATLVRDWPLEEFSQVCHEFQPNLQMRVTLFGAESTGKTTMAKALAADMNGHFVFEYARPYLENRPDGTVDVTRERMVDIWLGQRALQAHVQDDLFDKPFIFQDTDLFSTVGYWNFWTTPEDTPKALVQNALLDRSDLYLITQSNIPYEADPIRYGDGVRESSDQFWIDLCEQYGLNYRVLNHGNHNDRLTEAKKIILDEYENKVASHIRYDRGGF